RIGFTNYDFIRSTSESDLCKKNLVDNNPVSNFDVLWHTFNENYPSFDLRGIDWDSMRQKYRSKLNAKSTDLELYAVLNKMISELNDGHVFLEIPESLEDEIGIEQENTDGLRENVISEINSKYLDSVKTYNQGNINWGIIDGNIGYIQINDFEDLANYNINKHLSKEDFWDEYWNEAEQSENYSKDVLGSFKNRMATIFDDIKATKSCIIDVRFNGGGFDQVGLEVLSYFSDEKRIAFIKKARFKGGFTKKQIIYLEPNENQYSGDLFILTSYQTASASETFTLASMNLSNAKRIGSNTEGILSDILSKRLPNGWEYGLSNEIYESAKGINYERIGIPTDYKLNYSKCAPLFYKNLLMELRTEDKAIEKVIELEKEKTALNNVNKLKSNTFSSHTNSL
ncbi:S41 family peptidase, partial [Xanthovirga aplysinae]|uniref:S41 family peptidase n=1 Tax=Xanthovirga aplysinae TaxID=2529853 RepID=UPI00165708FF